MRNSDLGCRLWDFRGLFCKSLTYGVAFEILGSVLAFKIFIQVFQLASGSFFGVFGWLLGFFQVFRPAGCFSWPASKFQVFSWLSGFLFRFFSWLLRFFRFFSWLLRLLEFSVGILELFGFSVGLCDFSGFSVGF